MKAYYVEAPGGYTVYLLKDGTHIHIAHLLKADGWTVALVQQMCDVLERRGNRW